MKPERRVLVVEDDPLTRTAIKAVLEWAGYHVDCTANGREALDYLRGHEAPSLILLDLMMPVLDGRRFREEQQRDPALASIPVVVVSAAGDATLGAACHVRKPFQPQQLLEAVWQQE